MFHSFSWGVGESVIHTWPWWVVFSLSSSLRLSGRSNAITHILASTTWICKEKVTILYMVCSVNRRLAGLSYAMPCSCKSEMKTRDHWLGAEEPGGLERNTIKKVSRCTKLRAPNYGPLGELCGWKCSSPNAFGQAGVLWLKWALQEVLATPDANKRYCFLMDHWKTNPILSSEGINNETKHFQQSLAVWHYY